MPQYDNLPFHPTLEKVVDILRKKTQNEDPVFFRLVVSYFFSKIASMMRVHVEMDDQLLPVNMYAINLAPSGSGKGHSISIIENDIIGAFRHKFLEQTFPTVSDKNVRKLANARAIREQADPDAMLERTQAEFDELGTLLFSFDSGTSAAIKQMRTKLLMANAGSMNLEIDEIGSNMLGNMEVLNNYLELFDTGRIKQKLVKNTRENVRAEDLIGTTPTNMLLFGTPTKLLNGSKIEDEFYEMLAIGYARRCFFGFSRFRQAKQGQTAQDMYDLYHDPTTSKFLNNLSDKFGQLADAATFNQTLRMKKDVAFALYDYRIYCTETADRLSEYEEVRKAEIAHRYFKVGKLAAVYAYIDKTVWIGMDHLHNAIAMAEQSGEAFQAILNRDRPYVKLASYITSIGKELTQADLVEDLPFYKGSEQQKRELMNLAIAHGYKQGMYVRREIIDGVEFFSGKSVVKTDMNKMLVAYSANITKNYKNNTVPFGKLYQLVANAGYHWVTHNLRKGYRDDEHCIPGVNMVVLDVENSVDLDTAKFLLDDFTWLIHTTKRHTNKEHRFRIILPLSHILELDTKDFKDFMQNIFSWLPFDVDTQTGQRSRKWLSHKGKYWYNRGSKLDALQFVPKTKKADERKATLAGQTDLSHLERWFINNTANGNRNHRLCAYSLACVEMGQDVATVRNNVMALNAKLDSPLDIVEIDSTIMVTVSRRVHTGEKR